MVPRKMGQIWIGPHRPPEEWMRSWQDAHPDWSYRVYDNDYLCNRRFRNQALINEYFRQGLFAGVADLMRYEILLDEGGFIADADSICLHPVDELITEARAYAVYEFPVRQTGLISPFLASDPGNRVIGHVVEELTRSRPEDLRAPWKSTGNGFLRRFLADNPALLSEVTIFPGYYFNPEHYRGEVYTGTDRIYARQLWGTTRNTYPHARIRSYKEIDALIATHACLLERLETNLATSQG
ncbi:MAG: hypothetical protein MUE83_09195 [Tabrizicola sp.]|jgi:hypothetical protein|nr:hypothetical protein [Tabrizicola sp.]